MPPLAIPPPLRPDAAGVKRPRSPPPLEPARQHEVAMAAPEREEEAPDGATSVSEAAPRKGLAPAPGMIAQLAPGSSSSTGVSVPPVAGETPSDASKSSPTGATVPPEEEEPLTVRHWRRGWQPDTPERDPGDSLSASLTGSTFVTWVYDERDSEGVPLRWRCHAPACHKDGGRASVQHLHSLKFAAAPRRLSALRRLLATAAARAPCPCSSRQAAQRVDESRRVWRDRARRGPAPA